MPINKFSGGKILNISLLIIGLIIGSMILIMFTFRSPMPLLWMPTSILCIIIIYQTIKKIFKQKNK
jgi:hypothetical protein